MKYNFFPGCSLESTAREYYMSTRVVLKELGVELEELPDWTCCGASAAETHSRLLSFALPARNLALAERADGGRQLIASCSACYVNLCKVNDHIKQDPELLDRINQALSVDDLHYSGHVQVRHLLDVVVNDIGAQAIASHIKRPLTNLRVAPYYGCQTVRPYSPFDAPYLPHTLDDLLTALDAQVQPNPMKAACCGGTLMTTKREVGLKLITDLVQAVEGADCIVTVCPLCVMNLDSYQALVSKNVGHAISIPVLYLPELLGLALGLPEEQLGLKHHIVPVKSLLAKLAAEV